MEKERELRLKDRKTVKGLRQMENKKERWMGKTDRWREREKDRDRKTDVESERERVRKREAEGERGASVIFYVMRKVMAFLLFSLQTVIGGEGHTEIHINPLSLSGSGQKPTELLI